MFIYFLICPGRRWQWGDLQEKKSLKKQMWQLLQLQIIDQLYLEREGKGRAREKKEKKNY